jgi:uncharacterized protein (TIGR00255 family)
MIHSMTGFGRASGRALDREVVVEAKSVNNRFRDVHIRAPKAYIALEEPLKKAVAERLARGRLDIWVQIDESAALSNRLAVNMDLAQAYKNALEKLKTELNLAGEIRLGDLTPYRDVIQFAEEDLDWDLFLAEITPIVNEALDNLIAMRQTEGVAVAEDFRQRLGVIESGVARIEARRQEVLAEIKTRLLSRIQSLTENLELDENRLIQEAAYLADRSDITEELVRLSSHIDQFAAQVQTGGPVGRRLDFLLQEMNREVNTIGSKTQDAETTNTVVDMKTELEKLREQVQNVE